MCVVDGNWLLVSVQFLLLCTETLEENQSKVSRDVLDMRHSLSYMGVSICSGSCAQIMTSSHLI